MTQYGFLFDQSRCDGCFSCSVACKSWNGLPPGPEKWMAIHSVEKGTFPNQRINYYHIWCYHCENPVCVDAADGAMYKEDKYGAVLIDPEKATSPSLRKAWTACPYGAITFASDAPDAKASMCTMCIDRLEQGMYPVCVLSCPMRALDFGPLEELQKKHGTNRDLGDMPTSTIAKPAVIFKPPAPKKQIVPYPVEKALQLLARRDPLPPLYNTAADVTEIPPNTVGRAKLNLKPNSRAEFMRLTQDDTG